MKTAMMVCMSALLLAACAAPQGGTDASRGSGGITMYGVVDAGVTVTRH